MWCFLPYLLNGLNVHYRTALDHTCESLIIRHLSLINLRQIYECTNNVGGYSLFSFCYTISIKALYKNIILSTCINHIQLEINTHCHYMCHRIISF